MEELKKPQYEIQAQQAVESANATIVHSAISVYDFYDSTITVGEDTDLLVILTQLAPQKKVYFLKPGSGKDTTKLYDHNSFIYPEIKRLIAFAHAFTRSDTTSAFYNEGKTKFIKLLAKNKNLQTIAETFYSDPPQKLVIKYASEKIIKVFYGNNKDDLLDRYRYECFVKQGIAKTFQMASLPPPKNAAIYHGLRVYYQIATWMKKEDQLDITEWGWQRTENGLIPITKLERLVPDILLKQIACKCKEGCSKNCSCRKHGMSCTKLCQYCSSKNYTNCDKYIGDEDEDAIENEIDDILGNELLFQTVEDRG